MNAFTQLGQPSQFTKSLQRSEIARRNGGKAVPSLAARPFYVFQKAKPTRALAQPVKES